MSKHKHRRRKQKRRKQKLTIRTLLMLIAALQKRIYELEFQIRDLKHENFDYRRWTKELTGLLNTKDEVA